MKHNAAIPLRWNGGFRLPPAGLEKPDVWQKWFDREVERCFAGEHLKEVQELLAGFCPVGKCHAVAYLSRGDFEERLPILRREYKEYWSKQPADTRGDIVTLSDTEAWQRTNPYDPYEPEYDIAI